MSRKRLEMERQMQVFTPITFPWEPKLAGGEGTLIAERWRNVLGNVQHESRTNVWKGTRQWVAPLHTFTQTSSSSSTLFYTRTHTHTHRGGSILKQCQGFSTNARVTTEGTVQGNIKESGPHNAIQKFQPRQYSSATISPSQPRKSSPRFSPALMTK